MANTEVLAFVCPRCRSPLNRLSPDEMCCPNDGLHYQRINGIWEMLMPDRTAVFEQFRREYETIRQAEGRGANTSGYYRALPYRDLTGLMPGDWKIRATSFKALNEKVLNPLERQLAHPLCILDLGAGNGWLSNRLASRGHAVAAVDLNTNDYDGLGCCRHYETAFAPVQAEFDHLPFLDQSLDLVLFNASLHYSTSYENTLLESCRVLDTNGWLVIMDTPIYFNGASGEKMVRERENQFNQKYGFPSNALASENYLTYQRLADLAEKLDRRYEIYTPFYGLGWALRPWKARLLRRREPAKFHLMIFKP